MPRDLDFEFFNGSEVLVRAIVIDDSRAMRMILKRSLSALGFECAEAEDGKVALHRLQESDPFELALVDWNMPNMNGFELLCAVRKDHSFDDMKIMMVTTENEMERVTTAMKAGADEYVMKPFTDEIIREKLLILGFEPEVV
jgi:two-component system chemotaxis response regulator CheY